MHQLCFTKANVQLERLARDPTEPPILEATTEDLGSKSH